LRRGRQRRLRRLQAPRQLFDVVLRRQRRHRRQNRANVAKRVVGSLERQVGLRSQRLDARDELIEPPERLAPQPRVLLLRLEIAGVQPRLRFDEPRRDLWIDFDAGAQIFPLAHRDLDAAPGRVQIGAGRGGIRFVGQLGEPRAPPGRVLLADASATARRSASCAARSRAVSSRSRCRSSSSARARSGARVRHRRRPGGHHRRPATLPRAGPPGRARRAEAGLVLRRPPPPRLPRPRGRRFPSAPRERAWR